MTRTWARALLLAGIAAIVVFYGGPTHQPRTSNPLHTNRSSVGRFLAKPSSPRSSATQTDEDTPSSAIAAAGRRSFEEAMTVVGLVPADPVVDPAPAAQGFRQLDIRLDRLESGKVTPTMLADTKKTGELPALRTVELSEFQWLVVTLDAAGNARYATTVPDPLVLRAEFPDSNGDMQGRTVEKDNANLTIAIPADEVAHDLRFYSISADENGALHPHLVGSMRID